MAAASVLLTALAAVGGPPGVAPEPAGADHQWTGGAAVCGHGAPCRVGHWAPQPGSGLGSGGDEYRPWVSAPAQAGDWADPATSKWPFSSAAEWRWTTAGNYTQGFVTGAAAPNIACPATSDPHVVGPNYPAAHPGGIIVCYTSWNDPDLNRLDPVVANWRDGFASRLIQHPPGEIHQVGTLVKVCGNCWNLWVGMRTHQVMTHEYGHAIGLGHTAEYSNCVMNYNSPTETPCSHDSWATADNYNHWWG